MLCFVKKKAHNQPESKTEQNKYNHRVNITYDWFRPDSTPNNYDLIWNPSIRTHCYKGIDYVVQQFPCGVSQLIRLHRLMKWLLVRRAVQISVLFWWLRIRVALDDILRGSGGCSAESCRETPSGQASLNDTNLKTQITAKTSTRTGGQFRRNCVRIRIDNFLSAQLVKSPLNQHGRTKTKQVEFAVGQRKS